MLLVASPSSISSISNLFPHNCLLHSANSPQLSNKGNLEDLCITTIVGLSSPLLGSISKLCSFLPLPSMNITSLHSYLYLFQHTLTYMFLFPRNIQKNTFNTFCVKLAPLLVRNHCICKVFEYTHVCNIRLSSTSCFLC